MVSKQAQRGFIQNLILPSLVLMGIVIAGWGAVMNQNQTGVAIAKSVDASREQLEQLKGALNWCKVMYPSGDNGQTHHKTLPVSAGETWTAARTIKCPGDMSQPIWSAMHAQLPIPGQYMSEWEYRNAPGGVHLRLSVATAGDPNGRAVLQQVAARLHASQKNLTGDTLEILYSN